MFEFGPSTFLEGSPVILSFVFCPSLLLPRLPLFFPLFSRLKFQRRLSFCVVGFMWES